jgi:hypothetical protein
MRAPRQRGGVTDVVKNLSRFAISSVTNRIVSIPYPPLQPPGLFLGICVTTRVFESASSPPNFRGEISFQHDPGHAAAPSASAPTLIAASTVLESGDEPSRGSRYGAPRPQFEALRIASVPEPNPAPPLPTARKQR